jgi:LuxR family transcriptional regulator, maltose regulon positive regulatory protein
MATQVAKRATISARRRVAAVSDPVLEAKITVPGVPGWAVPRPRISKLIAHGVPGHRLTVVTGPPGAGKTMAMALWAAASPRAVAWVTLDDYDNRPRVFWSYVVAALRRAGVALPRGLSTASPGQAVDHVFLLRFASALAGQDLPVTLIIDDLHLLTDTQVLDGLDYVLRNAGPGLHLMASSRADPLLPLHRYRLAGELTEIRAGDLAFRSTETGLLMAQHGITLSAESLECLTRRTEGWAASIRLAAISMDNHPDPDQFVKELTAEDSAVTGYLVEEVLNAQPPEVREMMMSTSILECFSAAIASELVNNEQAGRILPAMARANAFVQPLGRGRYRYHTLFAEVLRLKLRREHPDRIAQLHRRAARWYERNGALTEAVRHAAETGDWQLAASMVIDGLAISEIIEPQGRHPLADHFRNMPTSETWSEIQPLLVCAAVALSAGRFDAATAALRAAEGILECLPADQGAEPRLAAAQVRLAASRGTGDLAAAAAAAAQAEMLVDKVPRDRLARHPGIGARVLSGRGAVELWSGRLDEAARVLHSGVAAATVAGCDYERAGCLGQLALAEALRGGLGRAADLAAQATALTTDGQRSHPNSATLVALALVHMERNELDEAHSRLKQADALLSVHPDRLVGAVAALVAAGCGLVGGHPGAAAVAVAAARRGWPTPPWLEQRLTVVESRAYAAAGDIQAAFAAAERAGRDSSLEVAVMFAHAWLAAGDHNKARRALRPALASLPELPERVRLQACLVDARLSYDSGDLARGRRSLESALRLAEPEQLRLPFTIERRWIRPVLRRDPALARTHRCLLEPTLRHDQLPARLIVPPQATVAVVEPLTERELEVLRHVSGMLSSAEVASEMYISINTVKTHLRNIYRKLAATHRGDAVRRARQLELI